MLARRSELALGARTLAETPLLVPSFSSRGHSRLDLLLRFTSAFITEALLISAYDLASSHFGESPDLRFARLVFLDSGGYEIAERSDFSDMKGTARAADTWDEASYAELLAGWDTAGEQPGLVAISYDLPGLPVSEQAAAASALLGQKPDIMRELLLKPERRSQPYINVDAILDSVEVLAGFDVIGVTEKEAGSSVLDRMESIARLRLRMDDAGLPAPIHVLGALDPLSAPLYCAAGAEIFDSLSWLRLAYRRGLPVYRQSYGILDVGISTDDSDVDARCWAANIGVLYDLELEMRAFCESGSFASFSHHADVLEDAYRDLQLKLRRRA